MPQPRTTTSAAAEPSATDVYALGREPAESARLRRQSDERGCRISGSRHGQAPTGPAIPAARSGRTWSAACAP